MAGPLCRCFKSLIFAGEARSPLPHTIPPQQPSQGNPISLGQDWGKTKSQNVAKAIYGKHPSLLYYSRAAINYRKRREERLCHCGKMDRETPLSLSLSRSENPSAPWRMGKNNFDCYKCCTFYQSTGSAVYRVLLKARTGTGNGIYNKKRKRKYRNRTTRDAQSVCSGHLVL